MSQAPVVLVHGLWDNPRIFNGLIKRLENAGCTVFAPFLPHKFGSISIYDLSEELDVYISKNFNDDDTFNLLGFSMGGLIGRLWIQKFDGARRTNRFITVGTPHKGTITAQLIPPWFLRGVSEMKKGSALIKELNRDINDLKKVDCISFFCLWDLMVFPGWQAVLPVGSSSVIPVLTHKGLIKNSSSLDIIFSSIIRNGNKP
tara:strand:- start:4362 stop:4967 length:606 start_codon:yes stop_codon:yes gene_type:complete